MSDDAQIDESTERWRQVVGYEGIYEVSNFGRVRSVARADARGHRLDGQMLTLRPHPRGYLQTTLTREGHCRTTKVHHLVLEAFVGPRPAGAECRHRNGKRDDNRAANLLWGTSKENAADRIEHGTQTGLDKTHCPRGHELRAPNLARWHAERGRRLCLACKRAHDRTGPFDPSYADAIYSELMGGTR